jgi:opacity protein-like surface antigen
MLLCGILMTAEGLNAGVMAPPPPDKTPRYVEPAPPACGPWFSALKGGWFWVEDYGTTVPFPGEHTIGFDTGGGITLVPLGYQFNDTLSFSLSGGWYTAETESVTLPTGLVSPATSGDIEIIPLLVNAVATFPIVGNLSVYAGLGIGGIYHDMDIVAPGVGLVHNEDEWNFGGNLIAGFAYEIMDCVSIAIGYRYHHVFRSPDDIQGHSVEAGVKFFW